MRCQSTPALGSSTQTQEAQRFTLKDSWLEERGSPRRWPAEIKTGEGSVGADTSLLPVGGDRHAAV